MTNMRAADSTGQGDVYVASFNDVRGWGGGVAAANGLAEACQRRGLRTPVLGVSRRSDTVSRAADSNGRINVQLSAEPVLWRFQSWRVVGRLRRFLRLLPAPRVAFVGNSPFWVVAAKRTWPQVRVVYRFPCLLTHCLPFTWAGGRAATFGERVNFAGIRRAELLALRLADLTLVATLADYEEVVGFCPRARPRVARCHFGCQPYEVDDTLRHHQRRALGLNDEAFLMLAVGVCDRNKAFDLAIREMARVDRRATLVVVGDGPHRPSLEQLAAQCGLADRVRFVDPQPDLAAWYAAADCVISTSFYDAYPNVIREAMWCGRPVVVPQHDPPQVYAGIAPTVRDAAAGLLYDRQRSGALADAVNRVIRAESGADWGARGRACARRWFSWADCVDHVVGEATPEGAVVGRAAAEEPAAGRTAADSPLADSPVR
jgi:glycosyltransferase involved in cell wall biosynthesis